MPTGCAESCSANTWFWPTAELSTKIFSKVMGSPTMQWAIAEANFFVEEADSRPAPPRNPDDAVMEHYRSVTQPDSGRPAPGWRACRRRFWRLVHFSERLARDVPAKLGSKPALLVWGMKDFAFRPGPNLPRMRAAFPDHVLVELPNAKHYIQEDAPGTPYRRGHRQPLRLMPALLGYANASTGGHEHTRLRSPYAPSMRRTGGHTLGR